MVEKRRFPRQDSAFEVRYSSQGNSAPHGYTVSKNVSRVGIRMPVSKVVRNGDTLDLNIDVSNKGRISATGRVKWLKKIERPSLLEQDAGVEFVNISPSDAEKLSSLAY